MRAVGDVVRHADRLEPDPGIKALVEARALAHAHQSVDGLAVEQAEVAGAGRQPRLAQPREQAIEALGERAPQPGIGRPVAAQAVDVFEALPPFRDHFDDRLGRMLEIGVHDHDRSPARMVEAGGDRDFLAEIAAEGDRVDPWVLLMRGVKRLQRRIARTVVDEDDLVRSDATFERRRQPRDQQRNILGLVVDRHEDGQFRRLGGLRGQWRLRSTCSDFSRLGLERARAKGKAVFAGCGNAPAQGRMTWSDGRDRWPDSISFCAPTITA